MGRPNSDNFRDLFCNDVPLMDMRAPVEFDQGAFPCSKSHPLMTDDERAAVGTCYKEKGQEEAIKLGHQLVNREVKAQRVQEWKAFCEANPNGYLYCFRGGMRSQITQQWLKEAGVDYPFVKGGYKAMRRFLIDIIETTASTPLTIVGGNTGCGKTDLVNAIGNGIDLEGAANHRGSSFGRYVTSQSTQINFENQLAIQMLKKQQAGHSKFVYEDEGNIIGSVSVPHSLYTAMQSAPVAVVEDPFEVRLERLIRDYVIKMQHDYVERHGEAQGWPLFAEYLKDGLFKIRRRLGYQRYEELLSEQQNAVEEMKNTGSVVRHENWLVPLLKQYYDPMYQYQLGKKAERIVFRGEFDEVKAWLEGA